MFQPTIRGILEREYLISSFCGIGLSGVELAIITLVALDRPEWIRRINATRQGKHSAKKKLISAGLLVQKGEELTFLYQ